MEINYQFKNGNEYAKVPGTSYRDNGKVGRPESIRAYFDAHVAWVRSICDGCLQNIQSTIRSSRNMSRL